MSQKMPSIFHSIGPDHEAELEKMRKAAMTAEVRRLLRIEARYAMQEQLRAAARDEGIDLDRFIQQSEDTPSPATGAEKAAAAVEFVVNLPVLIVKWTLYGIVLWFLGVFLYGLFVGFE